jgi:hypothetical protein
MWHQSNIVRALGTITAILLWLTIGYSAHAACPTTSLTFKDGSGVSQVVCFGGGLGAYMYQTEITQANAPLSTTNGIPIVPTTGASFPVTGTFWQSTQPVSIASLPTAPVTQSGTWTVQPGNTANSTAWLVTGTGGTFPVTGTFWQTTQPVSEATLDAAISSSKVNVNLSSVAASLHLSTNLDQIGGNTLVFGQAAMAGSIPVVIASNQTVIPASQSGSWTVSQSGSWTVTANAGTNLNTSALALDTSVGTTNTDLGAPGSTACSTDTASCSLNQQMQRLAQRLTTVNTTLGTPLQAGGTVVANAGTNLNTSALSTSANQTNASQKTQIVDSNGNVIASTSNNLNVQCANCSGTIGSGTGTQGTITTGGTAQNLFSGATPAHGFEVCNPDVTNDLWISQTTTAIANSGERVPANGGCYDTPNGMLPFHAISIVGAVTSQQFTSISW